MNEKANSAPGIPTMECSSLKKEIDSNICYNRDITLENAMLSEISLSQKDKYCKIPFMLQ